MKNLNLIKTCLAFLLAFSLTGCQNTKDDRQHFELRIYHVGNPGQEQVTDAFLKDVYLPALHRAGIPKVGVFKPVETDTVATGRIYVLIPFKSSDEYLGLPGKLQNDKEYNESGKSFLAADYTNPPYQRMEAILLKAFAAMPAFNPHEYTNPVTERIYELRSYESPTEDQAAIKREMFNDAGEMKLFTDLGFNAVFYGEALAGSEMPNLMYMTTFSDMKSHDEHWNAFRDSDEWKRLGPMERYKNSVSKVHVYLTHPASYSDF